MDWGNGTVTQKTLNENHRLKTLRHGPAADPGQFLDLEYDYHEGVANTGRIMSIIDRNDATKTVNYTYDGFNRLKTAATAGSHWGLSWTYDRYGNRLSQTVTKGTAPANSLSVNPATNRVNGWSYDAAGNTLNDGEHTYAYDANNMVKSVDGGAAQYKYDAAGRRVMKITAAETVRYAFGAEYSSVSGWKRVFVYAGGITVEYRSNQTYFHQSDHLGTPRVQTDSAGSLVETWSYYPFGEQWELSGSGGNERRFTGHPRDPETGNDYAGARYLKGGSGRWLTADPVAGNLADPQRLNRFRYVGNDPINFFDPDGREGIVVTVEATFPRVPHEPAPIPTVLQSPSGGGVGGGLSEDETDVAATDEDKGGAGDFVNSTAERAAVARNGRQDANLLTMSEECSGFIGKVMGQLGVRGGVDGFRSALNDAVILLSGRNSTYPVLDLDSGRQTTIGEFLQSHPDVVAVTFGGNIYLNESFYGQTSLQVAQSLLHEAFHLEDLDAPGGSRDGSMDSQLWKAAAQVLNLQGDPGSEQVAGTWFQAQLEAHCK